MAGALHYHRTYYCAWVDMCRYVWVHMWVDVRVDVQVDECIAVRVDG